MVFAVSFRTVRGVVQFVALFFPGAGLIFSLRAEPDARLFWNGYKNPRIFACHGVRMDISRPWMGLRACKYGSQISKHTTVGI